MSHIDNFFSLVTPKDLTKGVKISTIIHLGILLFIIVAPLVLPHKYRSFRPTVHTVQLVRLPGVKSQSISAIPQPSLPKPAIQEPAVKPKAETKPKQISVQKKPVMTIPSAKPIKSPTLEEKLSKRLNELEKKETSVPQKNWAEPAAQERPIVTGALGDSGTLGISGPSDFPFQWYLELIHGKISSCWASPQMVLDKQYSAVISFTITKTGEITNINIKRSSGISNFDESGIKAIELAKPFPELPPGYQYPQLTVNVEFALE